MTNQPRNKYDQSVSDFFHSKTFKTMLKVFGVVAAVVVLCVCVLLLVSFGGLAAFLDWLKP